MSAAFTERRFCLVPTDDPNSEDDFICDDKYVYALFINKKIVPLGKRILVRRLTGEVKRGEIVAAAEAQESTDQSRECIIEMPGILSRTLKKGKPERWKVNFAIGDRIMLNHWNEHWIEVSMDGVYYLVVREEDILYAIP